MEKKIKISPAKIVALILFVIYALSILFVIAQGIGISLVKAGDFTKGTIFPTKGIEWKNYADAFTRLTVAIDGGRRVDILGMTVNSLWYSAGSSFFTILFCSITAYIISNYKFPGRRVLYVYAIVTMMLPIMGSAASAITFYKNLGILDTNFMILMFTTSFGETFIILSATFRGISWEYAEAAFIDGAGHFRVWWQVMLPQAISPMFALFMVGFIGKWSDSDTALLFMKTHPTIASGLFQISHRDSYNVPVLFAGFMMSMIPVLALYIAFQKTIMDIQVGGGIKG